MLALSCQVIGNVGSSTMCFLLEVRVQIPLLLFIYSVCHMFCEHFVILFLLSVVSLLLNPCISHTVRTLMYYQKIELALCKHTSRAILDAKFFTK